MTRESALSPIEEQTLRALSPDVPWWAAEIAQNLILPESIPGPVWLLDGLAKRGFARLGLNGWTRTSEGTAALVETRSGVEVSGE